jgi:hypothetical protein
LERTGALVALAILDALLVAVVVVLALGPRTGAVPPAPQVSASGSTEVPTTGAAVSFRLPSGNISCDLSGTGASCTISDFSYAPPAPVRCPAGSGHQVVVDPSGVTTPCQSGAAPTADQTAPELRYGQSRTVGDYTCISAQSGVECTRQDGVGFRLAKAELVILP